jgi:hypothetical protein
MKKSLNRNLTRVKLLYVLYFATIVHLVYFIFLQDIQSSVLIFLSIFVYFLIPKPVLLLGSLIVVDTIKFIHQVFRYEGFSGSLIMDDLYDYGTQDKMNELDTYPPDISYNLYNKDISSNLTTSSGINIPKRTKMKILDISSNLWTRKDSLADKYRTLPPIDSSLYDYNILYNIPKTTVPYSTAINYKITHAPTLYTNI